MIRTQPPSPQEPGPLLPWFRAVRRFGGTLSVLFATGAAPLAAQSIVAGALEGVVADTLGTPLDQTDVTLRDRATGFARTTTTARDGRFRLALLPPGVYDAYVERIGFRPRLVTVIGIEPGATRDVVFYLDAAVPPVTAADTSPLDASTRLAGSDPFRWVAGQDLAELADPLRRMGAAGSLFAVQGEGLGLNGLPGRLGGVAVDGVPHAAARHPQEPGGALDGIAFPLEALRRVAPVLGGTDAEWPGLGGGVLAGSTIGGSRTLGMRVGGDVGDGERRGTLLVTGPIITDTVSFAIGFTAQRVENAGPAPWPRDSFTAAVDTIARDSLGRDLSAYLRDNGRIDVVSGFGRFDWQVASAHALTVRANIGRLVAEDVAIGENAPAALGSRLTAGEWSAAAELRSTLSRTLASEFRFGVDGSERDYAAGTAGATTTFADGGLAAGAGAAVPGRFERTTVRATEALHARLGDHSLKLGLAVRFDAHDRSYAAGRTGAFTFGGAMELLERRGAFAQAVGLLPVAAFKTREWAWVAQDVWRPARGLQLTLAVRASRETLPEGDVRLNAEWLRRTGISNAVQPQASWRVSPRAAFRWSVGPAGAWELHGEAGRYAEETDPAVLAEVRTHDGAVVMRRGFGALGSWPDVPDTVAAPVQGAALALLSAGFEAPRTSRAALSVRRALGGAAALHLGATYRHTDFLPRRRDLNLRSSSGLRDQNDRPIHGTLAQQGSVLGPVPGSNRRLAGFDAVAAIDPSGYSDYVALAAALERAVPRGVSLWASYTWSRTDDNWIGAAAADAAAQFSPFPDSTGAGDWTDGRSDFDVPHRAVVGAELRLPGRFGFRLAALLRYRSGSPFSPGFRAGVDANGDGVAGNDPAFVADTLPGDATGAAAALIAANPCLRSQVGRFAERNSCRGPYQASVDLRLALGRFEWDGHPAELLVDAINVVATASGPIDAALYLVDRTGALATSPSGVVTLPLVANPGFGRLLARRTPATVLRAGVRIGF